MVALGADHRNMCKFEHEQDPNYLEILNHMSREIDDLIEFGLFAQPLADLIERGTTTLTQRHDRLGSRG